MIEISARDAMSLAFAARTMANIQRDRGNAPAANKLDSLDSKLLDKINAEREERRIARRVKQAIQNER